MKKRDLKADLLRNEFPIGEEVEFYITPWLAKQQGRTNTRITGVLEVVREKAVLITHPDGEMEWFPRSQIRAEETADFGGLAGIAREFARDLIDPNFSDIEDDRLLDSVYRWMITGY